MPGQYRDDLAAARSRVAALEQENEALRRLQSGRPVTAGELEIVRLEGELGRIDAAWDAKVQASYGGSDPTRYRRSPHLYAAGIAAFPLVMALFIAGREPHGASVVAVVAAMSAVLYAVTWGSIASMRRSARAQIEKRAAIVRRIEGLRGTASPEPARVRVGDDGAVDDDALDAGEPDEARRRDGAARR